MAYSQLCLYLSISLLFVSQVQTNVVKLEQEKVRNNIKKILPFILSHSIALILLKILHKSASVFCDFVIIYLFCFCFVYRVRGVVQIKQKNLHS